jgi:tRNA pseudouridine38-40 synthase
MQRLRITLAYDGSPWQGWQGQQHGQGIQNQIQAAFFAVLGAEVAVEAAGRTDAGVHALAQVAHADVESTLPAAHWQRALNDRLPASIRVMNVATAPADFHARFSAQGKTYRYSIQRSAVMDPLLAQRAWHLPGALDLDLLQQSLRLLTGKHDFRRLSSRRTDVSQHRDEPEHTTRTLHEAKWQTCGSELSLDFSGDGFLYRMVRVLVGTAVHVARGRMSIQELAAMLADPSGPRSTQCAPPQGLYLLAVHYPTSATGKPAAASAAGERAP